MSVARTLLHVSPAQHARHSGAVLTLMRWNWNCSAGQGLPDLDAARVCMYTVPETRYLGMVPTYLRSFRSAYTPPPPPPPTHTQTQTRRDEGRGGSSGLVLAGTPPPPDLTCSPCRRLDAGLDPRI